MSKHKKINIYDPARTTRMCLNCVINISSTHDHQHTSHWVFSSRALVMLRRSRGRAISTVTFLSILFRCVFASLKEGLSVRPSVRRSVHPSVCSSVRRSVPNAFSQKRRDASDAVYSALFSGPENLNRGRFEKT